MAKKFYAPALRSGEMVSREVKKFYVPYLTNDQLLSKKVIKAYCSVVRNGEHVSRLFYEAGGSTEGWRQETNIPYSFANGSAVVYQNKIHLLGGSSSQTSHYSWDGTTWVQESTMPFSYYNGSAIVADGKIHCFGGTNAGSRYYTWDGTSWTQQPNLPDVWINPYVHKWMDVTGVNHAVMFNNMATLAGSNTFNNYGSWAVIASLNNGSWSTSWDVLDTGYYSACAYDGKIYMIGDSGTGGTKYAFWNGSSLSASQNLPTNYTTGYSIEYKNKIHLLGCASNKHYAFDGTTFTAKADIPYNGFSNCPAVVYNDRIHIFGSSTNHWSFG